MAQPAPKKLTTRATTKATTQKAKEEAAKKKKTTRKMEEEPRKRRKYVAQPNSDEERTESDDNSQFKVVSHPKSSIDKLCRQIKNDDLNDLRNTKFYKPTKEEKIKIEEYVYAMMVEYKHTHLELDGSMPKELYKIVGDKWHFF